MQKRIELYSFGDVGEFDRSNPYFLYRQKWAPEILFEIANSSRYELTLTDIAAKLNTSPDNIIDLLADMEKIGMLSKKQEGYSVSFTVILERDVPIIEDLTRSIALRLSKKIMSHKNEIMNLASTIKSVNEFGFPRIFYHLIGCDFLDGNALFEFGRRGFLSTSKPQFDGRDYILFGYEESNLVSNLSEKILCSRNCTGTADTEFVSFGDCDGNREDLFRFMKETISKLNTVTSNAELNLSYIRIHEKQNKRLAELCAEIVRNCPHSRESVSLLSAEEINAIEFMKELKFLKQDDLGTVKVAVPVFDVRDAGVIENISNYLIDLIESEVASEFSDLTDKLQNTSSVEHGVSVIEIANELWHQVFGSINEHLVRDGFFATPEYRIGEGRYFQAIYLEQR